MRARWEDSAVHELYMGSIGLLIVFVTCVVLRLILKAVTQTCRAHSSTISLDPALQALTQELLRPVMAVKPPPPKVAIGFRV